MQGKKIINNREQLKTASKIELLAVVLFFSALLFYLRFPVFELFSSHLLGGTGGDTNLYFWLVSTFPKNQIELGWFETNSYYPYQNNLAFSDNFLFPSVIFYCLKQLAGINEVASWNILILLAQLLNGISVYALAKKLRANFLTGFVLGSLFISSSYFAEHLGHPQLQFFFFIPFGLSIFLSLLERPCWSNAFYFAVIFTLTFLSTVYFAITLLLICALYFALLLLAKQFPDRHLCFYLFICSLFGMFLISPFIIPYLDIKNLLGARGLHEFYHFGLSALSFLAAAPISYNYGFSSLFSHGEAHFFWGISTLFLLFLGLRSLWQFSAKSLLSALLALILSSSEISSYLGLDRSLRLYLAAAFSWLAIMLFLIKFYKSEDKSLSIYLSGVALIITQITLGPLGYSNIDVVALGPFNVFYKLFPGIDSLRAISRLGSVVILLLSLAAIPKLNSSGRKVLLFIPFLILDARLISFPLAPIPVAPKIFSKLAQITDRNSAVLIVPLSGKLDKNNQITSWSEVAQINSDYLVELRDSAPLLMNGYSGQRPRTIYDLPRIMQRFPSEAALEKLLKFEKLKYLVVLGSKIDGFSEQQFLEGITTLGDRVRIIEQDNLDFIIEITRR